MPITPTTNLSLNMYDDGDNAGAGVTYSSAPTNTGLNGNWHKLDALVGGITTTAGVILPNKVTTSTIDTAAVTDTKLANNSVVAFKIAPAAIETNTMNINGSGQLQVKSLGIDTAQLKDNAVTSTKILDGAVTSGKLATDSVIDGKIADNIPKLKQNFVFTKNTATIGYFGVGNIAGASNIGINMFRAGSITGLHIMTSNGSSSTLANFGTHTFNAGDKLQVYVNGIQGEGVPPYIISTRLNGNITEKLTTSANDIGATTIMIASVEVEYN